MKYRYEGPVYEHDRLVSDRWIAETTANSSSKAISNLAYRWKKENNKQAYTPVKLPGKLKEIEI